MVSFLVSCGTAFGKKEEDSNSNNILLGVLVQENLQRNAAANRAKQLCETTVDTSYTSGSYKELCTPVEGAGRFFRIESLKASGDNGYFYLFLGYTSAPTSSAPPSSGAYTFAAGKSVSNSNPFVWFRNSDYGNYQGGQTNSGANPSSFSLSSEKEICINFKEKDSTAPQVNFWVTGVNGADCQKKNTLTTSNSIINYTSWPNQANQLGVSSQAYFRFSSTALLSAKKIEVDTISVF